MKFTWVQSSSGSKEIPATAVRSQSHYHHHHFYILSAIFTAAHYTYRKESRKSETGVGGSGQSQSDKYMAAALGELIFLLQMKNPTFTMQELHF